MAPYSTGPVSNTMAESRLGLPVSPFCIAAVPRGPSKVWVTVCWKQQLHGYPKFLVETVLCFPRPPLNAKKQCKAQREFRRKFILFLARRDACSTGHKKARHSFLPTSSPFLNTQVLWGIVTNVKLETLPVTLISTFKLHFDDRGAEAASHGEESSVHLRKGENFPCTAMWKVLIALG